MTEPFGKDSLIPKEIRDKFREFGTERQTSIILMGGGVLDVAGVRKAKDVDIVVDDELFEVLGKSDGWHEVIRTEKRIDDGTDFKLRSLTDKTGHFDVWDRWYDRRRQLNDRELHFNDLIENTWLHPYGFRIYDLGETRAMKAASPRLKDQTDSVLPIVNHLPPSS